LLFLGFRAYEKINSHFIPAAPYAQGPGI
jgi:hypothetical protein